MECVQEYQGLNVQESWNLMFKRDLKDHPVKLSHFELHFLVWISSQSIIHDIITHDIITIPFESIMTVEPFLSLYLILFTIP